MSSLVSPARKAQMKSMWIKCETPTTKRRYFIHRKTGKISWSDPFTSEDKGPGKGENSDVTGLAEGGESAKFDERTKITAPSSPNSVKRKPAGFNTIDDDEPSADSSPYVDRNIEGGKASTLVYSWTSQESKQLKFFLKRWQVQHERQAFHYWKIWTIRDHATEEVHKAKQKVSKLETKIKLDQAHNELAIARAEVESWKRARIQKETALRRSATRRLEKWLNRGIAWKRAAWTRWSQFTVSQRRVEMASLYEKVEELQEEVESWSTKARTYKEQLDELQSRHVVDHHVHEECVSEKERWEAEAKQKYEELEALRTMFAQQKEQWARRFSMQQEMIERLESDVEELSELKVLELAENYYDSVTT